MKTKEKYIAPTLKQYGYHVEGGFAYSISINPNEIDPNTSRDDNGFQRWGWNGGGSGDGLGGDGWSWDD